MTRTALRGAARLVRRGVAGAETHLAALVADDIDTVARILEVDREVVGRHQHDGAALAQLVRETDERAASRRSQAKHRRARELADRLSATSRLDGDSIVLDPDELRSVLTVGSKGVLLFGGSDAGIGLDWLRSIVRACRNATLTLARVECGVLQLRYETKRSRGGYRLVLRAPFASEQAFVVSPGRQPEPTALAAPPEPWWRHLAAAIGRAA